MPNVSGMSYEEAEGLLKEKNLNIVISGMNYSESIAKNKILSQTPGDGAVAEAEEIIKVIMSGGQEEVMMPDLAGMTREEARQMITGQNLIYSEKNTTEEYSDVVEKGRVIGQNIPAEERIAVQTEVSLSISLGSLSKETAQLEVPKLTGLTKEEAIQKLGELKEQAGFTYSLGEVKNKYSTDVKKGQIISQSPKAGESVRTNEPICIVISKGPEMVQIPELVYVERQQAEKKLRKAGLKAEFATAYSDQVAQGLVVAQSVEAGKKAEKGSIVTLTISLGKQPVQSSSGNGGNAGSSGTGNGGQTPSGGNSGTGSGGNSQQQSSGNSSGTGSSGNSQQSSGGSSGDNGSDGDRAIMPDGGSFVVE